MTLFLFDQPVPARRFAEKLGVTKDCKTYLCCRDGQVVAFTGGQLFEFAEASEYKSEYAQWKRDDLPLDIAGLVKVPMEKQESRIKSLSELVGKADKIVHAGAPDVSGQSAVDDLLRYCDWKGETIRLWNMDGSFQKQEEKEDFGLFAKTSSEISWHINENMRRAISCMLNSVGVRINISYDYLAMAVLGMIVEREKQIGDFGDAYYTIRALVNGIPVWSQVVSGEKQATVLCASIKREQGNIRNYTVCDRIDPPPPPHNLASLIFEAEKIYGISAFETMALAFELYENGLISYPGVDSQEIPKEMAKNARDILSSLFGMEGAAQSNPGILSPHFSDTASDFHAIIPLKCAWQRLQGKKLKIFKIIAKRYIQQFYPEKRYKEQEVAVDFGGNILSARGEIIESAGWAELADDTPSEIPKFRKGDIVSSDIVNIQKANLDRFSIADIISAMSQVAKYEINSEFRKLVENSGLLGLGREKVDILQFLKDRQYIDVDNNHVFPTKMGINFISWLPEKLYSPALASLEEQRLYGIAKKETTSDAEIDHAKKIIADWLSEIDKIAFAGKKTQNPVCPKCGADILERVWNKDREQYFWQCMNKACGRRYNDHKGRCIMPVKCPKCGKNTAERFKRKDSDSHYWFCTECKTYYDDNDGKIVPMVKCPECGEVALQRYESRNRPGTFYWYCKNKECHQRFGDDNGNVGRRFANENEKAQCPSCNGQAYRYESKKNKGEFYWRCKDCKTFFTDEGGKIGHDMDADKPHDKCPLCGGVAVQNISERGTPYWKCKADESHGPFYDEDGHPGSEFGSGKNTGLEEADCPHCDGKAYKTESKNKPGSFYWRCKNCGLMSDENGKPGKVFSAKR